MVQYQRQNGHDNTCVEAGTGQNAGQLCGSQHLLGLGKVTGGFQILDGTCDQIVDKVQRHIVKHNGGDQFTGTEAVLHNSRQCTKERTAQKRCQQRHGDVKRCGQRQFRTCQHSAQRANIDLTFRAQVDDAAALGDGIAQTGENNGRGFIQSLTQCAKAAERSADQAAEGNNGIKTQNKKYNTGNQESSQDGNHGKIDAVKGLAFGELRQFTFHDVSFPRKRRRDDGIGKGRRPITRKKSTANCIRCALSSIWD